ncbi:hypothetical protein INT48_003505, partial [Thamnidium elegans]
MLYFFISTCEEEGTNPDNMLYILLVALEYNWGKSIREYFDSLIEAFEKAKNDN